MTLDELTLEIKSVLRDPTMESSITNWLNQAMTELSFQFEFPQLRLRQPAVLTTTTADYLYNIEDAIHPLGYEYQRRVFRITSSAFQYGIALESEPQWINDIDPLHAQISDSVQRIAVEGNQLLTYPKANDSLSIYYYRKPIPMVDGEDTPDGIGEGFHYRVLVPHVVLKAFRNYPDELAYGTQGNETKMLVLWQSRLNAGLYGDTVQEGLLHALQKNERVGTPRLRGASYGSSLGGRWW